MIARFVCAVALLAGRPLGSYAAAPAVEHVVVIGVDGMSPAGIAAAECPNLGALMKRGAYTMHARAVIPTDSNTNWAAMIRAAGPGGAFPTIFSVLRQQRPEADIAVLHDWGGFGRLLERDKVTLIANTHGPRATTTSAVEYIKKHKPTMLFVQLDHVDHAGHTYGWGTPEYVAAVHEADAYVGEIVQAVADAGITDKTVVLVTADHGGSGKGHGGASMEEIEVPWIIAGPGVKPGHEVTKPLVTYQTAATIAYVFGLTPPEVWIAKPVLDAFEAPR